MSHPCPAVDQRRRFPPLSRRCPAAVPPLSRRCPAAVPPLSRRGRASDGAGYGVSPRQAVTMAMTLAGVIPPPAATSAVRSSLATDARISAILSAKAGAMG
jgi:hypothetical protein